MDLISIGEQLIDFLPGAEPGTYIRAAGGAPANVAIAVARNNHEVGFCGKVGDDDFGNFLHDVLNENDVAVLCPERTSKAVTTMAFVTLSTDGDRSFTFARKPGADMFLEKNELPLQEVKQASILHAGSCSLSKGSTAIATEYAIRYAHKTGKITSFDVNYRDPLWDGDRKAAISAVKELLPYLDWIKISEDEKDFLGSEADIRTLLQADKGPSLVVETLGAKGARAYFKSETIDIDGLTTKAVDTTGAGDAFWGGFLSSLIYSGVQSVKDLSRSKIEEALRYGTVSGWLCVQEKGAISSLPNRKQILEKIEQIYG